MKLNWDSSEDSPAIALSVQAHPYHLQSRFKAASGCCTIQQRTCGDEAETGFISVSYFFVL